MTAFSPREKHCNVEIKLFSFSPTLTIQVVFLMLVNRDLEVIVAKAGKLFSNELPPSFSPSVVHLSISMLMPCNDLRHDGMKEEERNLFSAQLCSAFCCCCYSNKDLELELAQRCLFAWQDRVIFFLYWKRKSGCKPWKEWGVDNSYCIYTTYETTIVCCCHSLTQRASNAQCVCTFWCTISILIDIFVLINLI